MITTLCHPRHYSPIQIDTNNRNTVITVTNPNPASSLRQTEAYSEGYGHDGLGVCLGDGQMEAYLKDTAMKCLASAWAMARRRPI